ncbi:hypothetical protein EST38_g13734 [Candolleomyces aberdarensis]|uniref:Uncharacterized protein n=1 Tax=Candolleomyces aberdarensis TaxID=2316362 RepID=A0A4Q2CZ18_9AGAR|nr:hypothetical protein EST38_g13734 [Candolleomyces aberdarensis]
MSFANCTLTIDPNPDVSGIGVRVAIYAQATLTLVQPVLAALDKVISEEELASLHMLYLGILMPGCALLLSAVIEASIYRLSVYHAIIVLNLSWINNTSALIFFQFSLIAEMKLQKGPIKLAAEIRDRDQGKELKDIVKATRERLEDARFGRALGLEKYARRWGCWNVLERWAKKLGGTDLVYLLERDFAMALVTTFHLTLFSAFGTWFWFTIAQRNDYCEQLTTHGIIFVSIPITSKPLRIASIVLYIISTIPFFNVVLFGSLELMVIYFIYFIQCDLLVKSSGRTILYSFIGVTLVLQIYFIISTELTIRFNAQLLKQEDQGANEENEWTFGQTLAIALIVVPLVQVWNDARKPENWDILKGPFRGIKRWFKAKWSRTTAGSSESQVLPM